MNLTNLLSLLPLALPAVHLIAACLDNQSTRSSLSLWLSSAGLGTALISGLSVFSFGATAQAVPFISPATPSYLLAILVAILGLIIGNFSRNYLAGDAKQARFSRMLHLTLAAVATVAISNNLFLVLVAWVAVSLSLNELLLFYPERPRAVLAAHKKFIFARIAECALLVAFILLYQHHGTAQISAIISAYPAELSIREHGAICLIAIAASIKCAQLPMHGWLIQVVESPTPVSALLHAGVVNLGGYLLILFAPLLSSSPPAITLLLVVSGLSATLASLIMVTRVTVKVKLAWSTVAQMGLMLMQCALGLYELAMLHLLAHACYKAYLFLRSGSAVQVKLAQQLSPSVAISVKCWLMSAAIAGSSCAFAAHFLAPEGPLSPWLLLTAFLTVALAEYDSINRDRPPTTAIALSLVLFLAYLVQKQLISGLVAPTAASSITWYADIWVMFLITALISTWLLLRHTANARITQTVRHWLFAGLFLDEWVTRTTLQFWPLRVPIPLPARSKQTTAWEGE